MSLSRRDFLRRSLGASVVAATSASVPGFLATTEAAAKSEKTRDDTILVIVQLAGGNDGLNTVVPRTDDLYAKGRPTLHIPDGKLHPIDADFGLHSQMPAFQRLYREGLLSVIHGVGYPNPNQDHPYAMRVWHSADVEPGRSQTGWIGRAVDQVYQPLSGHVPAAYLGQTSKPYAVNAEKAFVPWVRSLDQYASKPTAVAATSPADPKSQDAATASSFDRGSLLQFVERCTLASRAASRHVEAELRSPTTAEYPGFELAGWLRRIAQLIRADVGIRVFYTEHGGEEPGGFDTHAAQANNHGALLRQLSESIAAFVNDLRRDRLLDRVVLMTFSEFGRTVAENGRRGTDHGSAQPLFVVGGKVRGGLIGKHPALDDLEGSGQRAHTDFRRVYATLLDQWLKIDSRPVLGERFRPIDFLRG